ncbi:MAG: hypothetical protein HOE80_02925 [Candidatus Magasanikbacteria bacterium]|nr:hypothetical protein [Candidatus Magasanikbacteria bacterium]
MKNFFIVLCTFLLLPSIVHAAPATNYGCRVEGNLEEIEGGKNRLYTAISYTLDSGDVYDIPFSISMQTNSGSLGSYSGEVDLYYTGESVNQFDRTEINRSLVSPLYQGEAILTPEFSIQGNSSVQIGASLNGITCTPLILEVVEEDVIIECFAEGALELLDSGDNRLQYSLMYDVSEDKDNVPFFIEVVNNAGRFDSKSGTDSLYADAQLVVLYQGNPVQMVTIPAVIDGNISIEATLGGKTCDTKQLTLLELPEELIIEEIEPLVEEQPPVEPLVEEESDPIVEVPPIVEEEQPVVMAEPEPLPVVVEDPAPVVAVVSSPFASPNVPQTVTTDNETSTTVSPSCTVVAEGQVQENGSILLGNAITFKDFDLGEHSYRLIGYSENDSFDQTQFMDQIQFVDTQGVLMQTNAVTASFPMIFMPKQANETFVINAIIDDVVCKSVMFVSSPMMNVTELITVFPKGTSQEVTADVHSLALISSNDKGLAEDTEPVVRNVESSSELSSTQFMVIIIVSIISVVFLALVGMLSYVKLKKKQSDFLR